MSGDLAGALNSLSAEIAATEVSAAAIPRGGRRDGAAEPGLRQGRTYLERLCPSLKDPAPSFDVFGSCSGVPYGYVLQRLGDHERAGTYFVNT
jgi:hypothetical protein